MTTTVDEHFADEESPNNLGIVEYKEDFRRSSMMAAKEERTRRLATVEEQFEDNALDEESPRNVADFSIKEDPRQSSTMPAKADNRKFLMSQLSQQYDRGNKGYLDPTERAMKNMDTSNRGFLNNDKVYEIMNQSLELQKEMFNLKRIVMGLVVFAVILALSNLGTAFAAASLAKDTSVSTEGTLQDKTTHRDIATLNKGSIVHASKFSVADGQGQRDLQLIDGDENETEAVNATILDAYEITFDQAEMIWSNCEHSTPTKISHDCDGFETIGSIDCFDAQKYPGMSTQYRYAGGVMVNCGTIPFSPYCTVHGLNCPNENRNGMGGACSEEIKGTKPSMTEKNPKKIDDKFRCGKSCECESECCLPSSVGPICMETEKMNTFMLKRCVQ